MKPGDLVRYIRNRDLIALVVGHPIKHGNCFYISVLWTDGIKNDYDVEALEVESEGR